MSIPLIVGTYNFNTELTSEGPVICPVCELPTLYLHEQTAMFCFLFVPLCPISSTTSSQCRNCKSVMPPDIHRHLHRIVGGASKDHIPACTDPLIPHSEGKTRSLSGEYPFTK